MTFTISLNSGPLFYTQVATSGPDVSDFARFWSVEAKRVLRLRGCVRMLQELRLEKMQ